ncbi:MAG: ATP-binding cassette domain-containing protein, partial [Bacilli bacterium]|nr:ATP-binding cassette domain-containing protein [Bacilli bacterium]
MVAEEAKFDKKYSYLTPGVREQLKREKLYGEIPSCPKDVYVSMQNINKVYENGFHAVHDFNLDIKQHEFIVFVGPSGCGKSTSLRMIAGLEEITAGHLFIDGERVNDYSPKDRNIAMVFQSYALYPHMTVYGNMAYSLKINKFHIRGLTIKEKAKF